MEDSFLAGTIAGSLASETKESILEQELEKLQDRKVSLAGVFLRFLTCLWIVEAIKRR